MSVADVMEIARSCYWGIPRQDGSVIHPNDERHPIFCVGAIARALHQYGDERAREARKAAIEEVAQWCFDRASQHVGTALGEVYCEIAYSLRALSAKPGSET